MIQFIRILFILCNLYLIDAKETFNYITCGSVIKLANQQTDVRLHSHSVKYGSGSGQQSVTGTKQKEDVNSYWIIKGLPDNQCSREKVKCGSKLRFEHLETKKNLHSHDFVSPLSHNQEVSAFGTEGEGDTGDYWIVTCSEDYWLRDTPVKFKHIDTNAWLSLSGRVYDRPISGQYEIVGMSYPDSSSFWKVTEGVYIEPSSSSNTSKDETKVKTEHEEL